MMLMITTPNGPLEKGNTGRVGFTGVVLVIDYSVSAASLSLSLVSPPPPGPRRLAGPHLNYEYTGGAVTM